MVFSVFYFPPPIVMWLILLVPFFFLVASFLGVVFLIGYKLFPPESKDAAPATSTPRPKHKEAAHPTWIAIRW
jgi:hypothetical protein